MDFDSVFSEFHALAFFSGAIKAKGAILCGIHASYYLDKLDVYCKQEMFLSIIKTIGMPKYS